MFVCSPFDATATAEIYTLSLHHALPIYDDLMSIEDPGMYEPVDELGDEVIGATEESE